jgi:hypothetical protein
MPGNLLAGSGPGVQGPQADGPSPSIQGTLGAAPQAAPDQPTAPSGNMLMQGAQQPRQGQQAPMVPPSYEKLKDVLHKTSYVNSMLKGLLSKPDLSTKDILDDVGEMVADQVMSPFDAAKYLGDLPPGDDSLALRQWVGQHYATSAQSMGQVLDLIQGHGQMTRGMASPQQAPAPQQMGPPPAQMQAQPMPTNAFMRPQAGP